ncbi:hypothetical protein [Amycolatopsis thermoflava]|uniref:Uncharacterized protein n=1 Tax=Amycolatopsis thermoflava TaxID=84480 RepID=A0A3N2H6C4_9PSEU|nr:hypothetical protein [Amycolatopsis thermoflava]ROS44464.1 hypothetical protein EDD35_6908 [Amycolatopsis thermoflava]
MLVRVGDRLASAVCGTQVIVVRPPRKAVTITCGGEPMRPLAEAPAEGQGTPVDTERGTLLGKRYIHPEYGLELLCTKPGDGTLRADGVILEIKEAKSLPSSD